MKRRIIIVIVLLLIVSLFSIGETLSRYINTTKWDYSYNSKDFYFTSDYLSEDEKTLYYNSWDGSDITFNISNALNKDTYTSENITYEVSCSSEEITCLINGKSKYTSNLTGNKYSNEELKLSLSTFKENANVTVIAKSTKPYKKTLQVTFDISKETSLNDIEYKFNIYENSSKLLINNNSNTDKCINISILKDNIRVSKSEDMNNIKTNSDNIINSFDIVLKSNEDKAIDMYGNNIKGEDVVVGYCD